MAAYNLELSPLPMETSSATYLKILQNQGWVEYKDSQAAMGVLSRGYARAFRSGEYRRSKGKGKGTVSGIKMTERVNRGIVFWAYRKCRDPADRLGAHLGPEDLGNLHKDAEALVEMLVDINRAAKSTKKSAAPHLEPFPDLTVNFQNISAAA